MLLEAHARLSRRPPLLLIGARREGRRTALPDGVVLVENVRHDDVMRAWAASSVAVAPSLSEAFGLLAVEAMAAGTPVVASSVGGLPDVVVDGETGFLVPPGNAQRLRDVIQTLLNDDSLRQGMGAADRERAKAFQG